MNLVHEDLWARQSACMLSGQLDLIRVLLVIAAPLSAAVENIEQRAKKYQKGSLTWCPSSRCSHEGPHDTTPASGMPAESKDSLWLRPIQLAF